MFRLLKLCVSLAAFLVVAWFGATVKLGSRTLFEHLHAIGQTKESQELVDGTKQAAEPLVDDVKRRIGHGEKGELADKAHEAQLPALSPDAGAAQDDFSPTEKRQLRRLLGVAERHASRE
ncbi:MAG TPA: hypothetical protein VLA14_02985 [Polyangia bacterium]|jgi:hypothetical protein|nr:hypothetical protein [Polyangia bacterium]